MKLLSVAIPCYNSQDYMEHAVSTLLSGGEDVEILIIDDGSSDRTLEIAKELEKKHPTIVRAIHQENKGHGGAVNTGIANATGLYFKVVDSDDWVREEHFVDALNTLKELVKNNQGPDMFVCNYVYEKVGAKKKKVVSYRNCLPVDRIFTWDEVGHFKTGQYILMHSVIYRTKMLHDCELKLPEHTFYVDNIYVYQPLPSVKTIYYKDVNLYRYFIGRSDQSVSEKNMMKRIDQQLFVNKTMLDLHDVYKLPNKRLRDYMTKYLIIMMMISSVFLIKLGDEESLKKKEELWDYAKKNYPKLYRRMSFSLIGAAAKLHTKVGIYIVKVGYKIAQDVFQFN